MQGSGATVHGLTWDCSAEFAATADQSVSFLHENSFISFPNWISRTGAIISFRVSIVLHITVVIFGKYFTFLLFELLAGCNFHYN